MTETVKLNMLIRALIRFLEFGAMLLRKVQKGEEV
jgi:hypothetical protein